MTFKDLKKKKINQFKKSTTYSQNTITQRWSNVITWWENHRFFRCYRKNYGWMKWYIIILFIESKKIVFSFVHHHVARFDSIQFTHDNLSTKPQLPTYSFEDILAKKQKIQIKNKNRWTHQNHMNQSIPVISLYQKSFKSIDTKCIKYQINIQQMFIIRIQSCR